MNDLLELYDFAEREGIQVDCFELQKRKALSIMDASDGKCYIAIDPMKLSSSREEKVILAHEEGHCATGSFYSKYASCDIRQKHENRADKWAIMQLIPFHELRRAILLGNTEVWSLADHFDVPEDFMKKAICWYMFGNLAVDLYFK